MKGKGRLKVVTKNGVFSFIINVLHRSKFLWEV